MQRWNIPWRGNNSQKHNAVNTFEKFTLHCFARKIITQLKWSVSLESDLMFLEIETWLPSGPRKYTRKISKCKQLFALEPNSRTKPHIFTSPIYMSGHQSASCDNPLSHTPAKNTQDPPCNAKRKRSPLIRGEKSHVALCVTRFIAMIECWLLMAVLGSPSLMFLFAWNALISCPLFKIICFFLLFLLFFPLSRSVISQSRTPPLRYGYYGFADVDIPNIRRTVYWYVEV